MTTEIKVPVLPESVQDAMVATWHKQPGDHVSLGENLVDLETDKVVLEVPAPADGILKSASAEQGATVTAGQVLGILEEGAAAEPKEEAPKEEPKQESKVENKKESKTETPDLSPSARRAVQEAGLTQSQVPATGSGKDGRVTKQDVAAVSNNSSSEKSSVSTEILEGRVEKRVPMTRLRAKIAERLVKAQQDAAILTTFNEVNLQEVANLRKKYQDQFVKEHDIKLGFMSFFVKAAVEALKRSPMVNASIDGNDVVYHGYYDIGVAVSSERGLVVPIIRNADQLSMAEIEKTIKDFGKRAQAGQISLEEMTGGTFTISNGGVFGSMLSTPILNPPQSAILGMHNIIERPIAENGEVVIRPMMYLALSYDHRIIDGKESVTFLKTIKELLEDPSRLLLDI